VVKHDYKSKGVPPFDACNMVVYKY